MDARDHAVGAPGGLPMSLRERAPDRADTSRAPGRYRVSHLMSTSWQPRAFFQRFVLALLVTTVFTASGIGMAYWVAADKIDSAKTAEFDPGTLDDVGRGRARELPDHRLRHPRVRRQRDRRGALRRPGRADRSALRHDHDRPHRSRHRDRAARVVPARPVGRHPGQGQRRRSTPRSTAARNASSRRSSRTSTSRSTTTSRSTSPASATSSTRSARCRSTSRRRPSDNQTGLDIDRRGLPSPRR